MPAVAFVAPYGAPATLRFVRAVAGVTGTACGLVSQEPLERVPEDLRGVIRGHWRIDDALDPAQIVSAVRGLETQIGPVDRIVGILEQALIPIAEARGVLGIEGMDPESARNFRDKSRMKTVLREAGVPCARHAIAADADAAITFATETGFPLVLKPPAGAGARSTHRVENMHELRQALELMGPSRESPVLLEEFIRGREFSFDSVFVDGAPVWHSFSHYTPGPLEVLENPWIQWCVLLPRHVDEPAYDKVRDVAVDAVRALGMQTGMSHLEWFLRPDGSVAISEVGARPPGAQFTSLISYAHDTDFYRAWAELEIHRRFEPPPRKYAVGAVYLRGQGGARVTAIHGLDRAQAEIGSLVVEAKLPQPGQPASGTYEGEGHVIVRDESTDVVRRAMDRILEVVKVEMA